MKYLVSCRLALQRYSQNLHIMESQSQEPASSENKPALDSSKTNNKSQQIPIVENKSEKGVKQFALEKAAQLHSTRKKDLVTTNNTGLPDHLKNGIEQLSGYSMDDVSVHYNSSKPAQLQAHAYAQGSQIHLGQGQEKHLPHEAWHVVQQKQGRVKSTRQLKGKVNINDDVHLEKEADIMGAKALQMRPSAESSLDSSLESNTLQSNILQGRFGLELEFPIPVDGLGALTPEQEELLRGPLTEERFEFQRSANLPKDTNIERFDVAETSGAFSIVTDHLTSRFGALAKEEPARVIYPNILEIKYSRPIETLYESKLILNDIFAKVQEIETLTNGFSERRQLSGNYYVGPINTGGQTPEGMNGNASSIQINFGIETQKIPDFLTSYAGSTELQGDQEILVKTRANLIKAAQIGVQMGEELEKRFPFEGSIRGLKGIFSIMALYLLSGKDGQEPGTGTIKNFSPLFLKTNLNDSAAVLTDEEAAFYNKHSEAILGDVLKRTGRPPGFDQQLVKDAKSGDTVLELIGKSVPFAGKTRTYLPDSVGPSRVGGPFPDKEEDSSVKSGGPDRTKNRRKGVIMETRYASGSYSLQDARAMAEEMFMRVEILHNVPDSELMTSAGQSDFVKRELGVEEVD